MAVSSIRHLVNNNNNRNGQLQPLDTLRLLLLLSINNADKAPKPAAFDQRLAMMWAFARDLQRQLQSDSDAEGVEGGQEEEQGGLTADLGLSTLPYFHEKSAAIAESDFYYGHAAGDGDGDGDGDGGMDQLMLVGYDTLIRIFNPKYYRSSSTDDGPATTPMQQALDPLFARARLRVVMRADDEWGSATEQRAYLADLLEADGLSRVGGRKEWASRIEIEMVEGGRGAGAQDVAVSSTYARAAARDGDSQRLDKMVSPSVRQWIEQEALYTE
jgi:nicotinamide-nucleotide adenylyltransferase